MAGLAARVQLFWSASLRSDPWAFVLEMISFVFTVVASLYLAIHAADPDMRWVYPFFMVGAVSQAWASYRRGSAWIMLLTIYFAIINVFGFGRAVFWW